MKKLLLIGGVSLAGFGLYRYFNQQVKLALNYDYKLKDFNIIKYDNEKVDVSAVFSLTNKSNFQIEVKSYDLNIYYKDILFANTKSDTPIIILPNKTFDIIGKGSININKAKIAILPFVKDVLERKPIDISVSGEVKIVFLNIPTTLKFDNQTFNYSVDLLQEYKLDKTYEKIKTKYPKLFSFLGIK